MKNNFIVTAFVLLALFSSCKKDSQSEDNINPPDKVYPTDGLVSYFNFDNNLKDQLGNTPDGTNVNGATFTEGKAGSAITFNGTNQSVEFGRKSYKNLNTISVSLWVKISSIPNTSIYFVVCSDFGVFTTNAVGFAISLPSTNNAQGTITPEVWTHFAGTYDGTNIKAYVNGELKETKNHPGEIYDADRFLTLGTFNSGYWGGSIDDLFIYKKALSQAEINQLYAYH
jgi:hypothetical protein